MTTTTRAKPAPSPAQSAPEPEARKAKKAPKPPLPASLTKALPSAAEIVRCAAEIEKHTATMAKELAKSKKQGAIQLARSFAVLHRAVETVETRLKPLAALFEVFKGLEVPAAFDAAGVTHVPLAEGYRVGVSYTLRASIPKANKAEAYAWLGMHHPDIITTTVNASTLSGLASELLNTKNTELPEDLFKVVNLPSTSVTQT